MQVPYLDLKAQYAALREEVLDALDRVGRNASFVLGEEVAAFEREFAAYCEVKHCVALASGMSALHLALVAADVGPGDEVITTPNTFVGTAEAISYTAATPVFADINPATANIDPREVARAVTARTRAIIPVHLYGQPADLDPILEIARQHNLAVIEDACQAHGARYRGRRVGSFGLAAAFSFYPTKNLGAYGDAGALTTQSDQVAARVRALRNHGESRRYFHDEVGYNARMDGFQGAILRLKLQRLDAWNARRRELAGLYRRLLAPIQSGLAGARAFLLEEAPGAESVFHLFAVYVDHRDRVRAELEARGVASAVHYPRPVHLQPCYASLGLQPGSFPHAERACERVVSLPFFPELTTEQVEYVAAALREIVGAGVGRP